MTQALNPKVQEIKEKYADNKDLQNQMTALLYQETKVTALYCTALHCTALRTVYIRYHHTSSPPSMISRGVAYKLLTVHDASLLNIH